MAENRLKTQKLLKNGHLPICKGLALRPLSELVNLIILSYPRSVHCLIPWFKSILEGKRSIFENDDQVDSITVNVEPMDNWQEAQLTVYGYEGFDNAFCAF